MEKQKKNDSGITLVALVVSIIVMLVLAGVSLNATIGENGIVTRAQEAVLQQKIAEDLENLNLELAKINVDTISTDETMAIQDIASYLVSQGAIDSFITTSAGQIAAGIDTATGNKYFFGTKGDNTYRITRGTDGLLSAEITTQTSGGDITGGYALITADSFNNDNTLPATEKGKFTITSDAEVVFMDTISGALSIYVADNVHATVGIYANMTLTNQGVKRSAIDISKNSGILDLYIGDGVQVTVNSGLGEDAAGNTPGKGGYAGIHVPEGATLNIKGNGTVTAIGGNAGNGGDAASADAPSAGGGGAGAGIGGNGGTGGTGKQGVGNPGGPAENMGMLNVFNTTTIYAYGGAGGSGGTNLGAYNSAGGGGGYPGAGIGGGGAGGAGGTCCAGAGGYTGGTGDNGQVRKYNGLCGHKGGFSDTQIEGGGGYFEGGVGISYENSLNRQNLVYGGFANQGAHGSLTGIPPEYSHMSGNGGTGGSGGTIRVSKNTKIYAFNGNLYTDGLSGHEYNNGINQCPIYAQDGVVVAKYQYTDKSNDSRFKIVLQTAQTTVDKSGYQNKMYVSTSSEKVDTYVSTRTLNINTKLEISSNSIFTATDMSYQGVGSGAGYTETSNGTYTVYNEDSNGNFTTVYTET